MKKKRAIAAFALFLIPMQCLAQNAAPQYSADSSKRFSGCAIAFSRGNLSELENIRKEDLFELISDEVKIKHKLVSVFELTENDDWLFRKAMNERDYKKGDVYGVICAESEFASEASSFL